MIDATLCFLTEGDPPERVLLGFKKRGFGAGKFGGFGGKIELGETAVAAAARELAEEAGIHIPPERLHSAGRLVFHFPAKPAWNQTVYVYLAESDGQEPVETDEMAPTWFPIPDIPFAQMWHDNVYWLPMVLGARAIDATFIFKPDNATVETAVFDSWMHGQPLALELRNAPGGADAKAIHEGIKSFNNAASPHHLAARKPDAVSPLNLFIRDEDGKLLGGLTAETYWNWLEIDDLWLDERLRGNGLGRDLIQMAEEQAIRRGCEHAHLQTFSFQARGFYEKQGYQVVGELSDYPPGQSFFWMRKELSAQ